jgi:hypothetical protein
MMILPSGEGKYVIQSQKTGYNLQCNPYGHASFANTNFGSYERFSIEKGANGEFFFVSELLGRTLQMNPSGRVGCVNFNRMFYERFDVIVNDGPFHNTLDYFRRERADDVRNAYYNVAAMSFHTLQTASECANLCRQRAEFGCKAFTFYEAGTFNGQTCKLMTQTLVEYPNSPWAVSTDINKVMVHYRFIGDIVEIELPEVTFPPTPAEINDPAAVIFLKGRAAKNKHIQNAINRGGQAASHTNKLSWEELQISSVGNGKYVIQSQHTGRNLQCNHQGRASFRNTNAGSWERFSIERGTTGQYFFVSELNGRVLQMNPHGHVSCANSNRLFYESFDKVLLTTPPANALDWYTRSHTMGAVSDVRNAYYNVKQISLHNVYRVNDCARICKDRFNTHGCRSFTFYERGSFLSNNCKLMAQVLVPYPAAPWKISSSADKIMTHYNYITHERYPTRAPTKPFHQALAGKDVTPPPTLAPTPLPTKANRAAEPPVCVSDGGHCFWYFCVRKAYYHVSRTNQRCCTNAQGTCTTHYHSMGECVSKAQSYGTCEQVGTPLHIPTMNRWLFGGQDKL